MIYDKLCGIVERLLPEYRELVASARLFQFPGKAQNLLPTEWDQPEFIQEQFFLPFQTIAVEDAKSVVILQDPTRDTRGWGLNRRFIEYRELTPMTMDDVSEWDRRTLPPEWIDELITQSHTIGPRFCYVAVGVINSRGALDGIHTIEGWLDHIYAIYDNSIVEHGTRGYIDEIGVKGALIDAKTAIEEVIYFNTPDRFIVEVNPTNPRRQNGVKIPRL